MGNKTREKKNPRRRAGASDSGIHLIALKWKRFLASHWLLFKEKKSSQIPHVYQPSGDFSSSSMNTNPSLSLVPPVILLLILRKLLLGVGKRQRRQKFVSFARLPRPEKSLGKGNHCKSAEYFISVPSKPSSKQILWQITAFAEELSATAAFFLKLFLGSFSCVKDGDVILFKD